MSRDGRARLVTPRRVHRIVIAPCVSTDDLFPALPLSSPPQLRLVSAELDLLWPLCRSLGDRAEAATKAEERSERLEAEVATLREDLGSAQKRAQEMTARAEASGEEARVKLGRLSGLEKVVQRLGSEAEVGGSSLGPGLTPRRVASSVFSEARVACGEGASSRRCRALGFLPPPRSRSGGCVVCVVSRARLQAVASARVAACSERGMRVVIPSHLPSPGACLGGWPPPPEGLGACSVVFRETRRSLTQVGVSAHCQWCSSCVSPWEECLCGPCLRLRPLRWGYLLHWYRGQQMGIIWRNVWGSILLIRGSTEDPRGDLPSIVKVWSVGSSVLPRFRHGWA